MTSDEVLRLAAFSAEPGGGNPAGVVLDARDWTDERMQQVAADLGFAETAFVTGPPTSDRHVEIRYFSPHSEVPFCGHATIATAVALAEQVGTGPLVFHTPAGPVEIVTSDDGNGVTASFTSVEPYVHELEPAALDRLLGVLHLTPDDVRTDLPPRVAYAGAHHPVLVLRSRETFDGLTFVSREARDLLDEQDWVTMTVLWQQDPLTYEARNVFPVGEITEDYATGAAAAATGAYLRSLGAVRPPVTLTIRQGHHVGRPSVLRVDVPPTDGITVTGTAVPIAD
ncbi:PhzF family phenazine biosynthesis isomerase [Luteipulveratus sp. YIM 133132]|uniref:PhzF family phenazine biosynthesis protein n=1 Tax=Luteipulveratus flavus TaxID=3031728 RepID=UPI0023B1E53F|nr:PhzF family phenazine biosynthesis isomerase [Luteipulveratus sp. YIM 133132]MDE9366884.1 PhzF family phenazine biosynthesis isomerase [Luteipulveratus sp. YIM 133132]